jgi:hypothetical protein
MDGGVELAVVVHSHNPRTLEAEAGGLQVQGVHSKIQGNLDYIVGPYLKVKNKRTEIESERERYIQICQYIHKI